MSMKNSTTLEVFNMDVYKRYRFRFKNTDDEFTVSAYCEEEAKVRASKMFVDEIEFMGVCDEEH
jgi:hypothetical protein